MPESDEMIPMAAPNLKERKHNASCFEQMNTAVNAADKQASHQKSLQEHEPFLK